MTDRMDRRPRRTVLWLTRRALLAACTMLALTGAIGGQSAPAAAPVATPAGQTGHAAPAGTLRVGGAVSHPVTLSREEIASLPHQSVTAAAHGQSGRFDGVPLIEILKRAGVPTGDAIRGSEVAKSVIVTGADGYRVIFALAELDAAFTDRVVLLADTRDGAPLPDNARPYQVIVPGEKRPARWIRQVVALDVVEAPRTP